MKVTKVLVCMLTITLTLGVGAVAAFAAVSGPCANCHTMHNSQGGDPMQIGGVTGPQGALVRSTCLGCHTTSGTNPLVGGFPYVRSTVGGGFTDNNCLAGGFFQAAADGTDNLGRAHSLTSTVAPPGYNSTWYQGGTNGLSCAGDSGCHGSQTVHNEMGAIKGGHHSPTVYRILWAYNSGAPDGVVGTGAADYEKALIASLTPPAGASPVPARVAADKAHNIYSAGAGTNTISKLCANCHGAFHGAGTGSASPWLRHPTEVALPADWAVQGDALVTNVDCKYNPFGFVDHTSTAGQKLATCLSCHRAHGTANYDLLRFAYSNYSPPGSDTGDLQEAGSHRYYGCLGCHSKQR